MDFKTKDLLVTVLPKVTNAEIAKYCLLHTHVCRFPTLHCLRGCSVFATCAQCSVLGSVCGVCSLAITCAHCSLQGTIGCGFGNSCGPGGSACDPTIFCAGGSRDPWVIEHLEDLVALRAELQDTLKQLDAIQKEGLPSSIATKAQAEALERSLTEALDQVRAAKKGLK
jgi:hypothetical protein